MDTVHTLLTGLGNIGRTFLEMLIADPERLPRRYGFRLKIVALPTLRVSPLIHLGLIWQRLLISNDGGLEYESCRPFGPISIRLPWRRQPNMISC